MRLLKTRISLSLFCSCLLLAWIPVTADYARAEEPQPLRSAWITKLEALNSRQAVIVEARSVNSSQGTLSVLEKQDGEWEPLLTGIPVVLGKNGIGKSKEGDGRTPSGVFLLGEAFGSVPKPEGLKLTYTPVTPQDYWIDDPVSKDYNKRVRYAGKPQLKWNSYEKLSQPAYKYAAVIRYNDDPIVKGKGSAIFLHIWRSSDHHTEGCIAMAEPNLLRVLQALDPDMTPAIAIGAAD